MRCRHFTIRLSPEHAPDDESRLNTFLESVHVQSVQTSASAPGCWSILVFYEEIQRGEAGGAPGAARPQPASVSKGSAPALAPREQDIYERLREWRSQRASAEGKPAYVIATNAVLMHIARYHMTTRVADDLASIRQFGPARTARYGPEILHLLHTLIAPEETFLFDDQP